MRPPRLLHDVALFLACSIGCAAAQAANDTVLLQQDKIISDLQSAIAAADANKLEDVAATINELLESDDKPGSRLAKVQLWLRAIDGVHASIDPMRARDDQPSLNIAPRTTGGVYYDSGIDPQTIKDPVVRSDYEKELAANAKKAQKALFRDRLQQLQRRWANELEAYTQANFSGSSSDIREIDLALDRNVANIDLRAKLRTALIKSPP